MTVYKRFCLPGNYLSQSDEGDEVGESHEGIKDISNVPYGFYCHVRTDEYRQDVEPAIGINGGPVSVGKIFQTALSVIIPSQDGGECKEDKTDHKYKGSYGWREGQAFLEGIHSNLYAFKPCIPASCHDDAQAGHGTDDNSINESTRHGGWFK